MSWQKDGGYHVLMLMKHAGVIIISFWYIYYTIFFITPGCLLYENAVNSCDNDASAHVAYRYFLVCVAQWNFNIKNSCNNGVSNLFF